RAVQEARKAAGLEVGDRVHLTLTLDEIGAAAAERHRELIAGETLAIELTVIAGAPGDEAKTVGESSRLTVEVAKA
ncbi:MAG: DUF5915 domain-containing protein, partial [Agromyces sp.]